jgi:hypothetical protein
MAIDYEKVSKLRTYKTLKTQFSCESSLLLNLKRNGRSIYAQFRCGILPTGRYVGEEPKQRHCTLCQSGLTENETHFLIVCPEYNDDL